MLTLGRVTVAIVVKVWDGIVLAADSATSMRLADGSHQVYNTANKIFHLHRDLPVAAMTWGLGSIGPASIATLAKDLRTRLMGKDPLRPDWALDPSTFTVEAVANRLVDHMFDELFSQVFDAQNPPPSPLGFLVAGYSAGSGAAEGWLVEVVDPASRPTPLLAIPPDAVGWVSFAQPFATERLWNGYDRRLRAALESNLDAAEFAKVGPILDSMQTPPVVPSMPLADAIALGQFMVDVTTGYTHFLVGPNTVGGPTEVASMSRHEGFKWIARKHYYTPNLNPRETGHVS